MEALFFLVRGRTSTVLEDAIEASPLQGNKYILLELYLLPPLATRLELNFNIIQVKDYLKEER